MNRAPELERTPSPRTLRGLDALNFLLADVQTGVGPFLAIYLAANAWNEQRVGLALTLGGIAGIVTQTPAGALVDSVRSKRALVAIALASLAAGALTIALLPSPWPVMSAQILIGGTSSVFIPAVCAMSLGIVGHTAFDERQGRNQTLSSAGNVVAAVSMGLLGYWVSNRSIFFFVVALSVPTLLALRLIKASDIDYELARGAADCAKTPEPGGLGSLLRNRPLLVFLLCAVLFHFANAAMLPLLGELLAKGRGRRSMLFMSACVVTTQVVITAIASWSGRSAAARGRRPLLLLAFGVLPIRGFLYTLTTNTALLIGIQVLDGIGAGIFGVVSVLVISDLTRGTGRFNLTLGAITTAIGIGASCSQFIAGSIAEHVGFRAAFLFLSVAAVAAFAIFYCFMPETNQTDPRSGAQA